MNIVTWLALGLGVFILYCAVKGLNPLTVLANRFGITTASPAKLRGAA
jgi:hypothetical protein